MKKILLVLSLVFLTLFSGCEKVNILEENLSELKSDIYYFEDDTFSLSIQTGFKESPMICDGKKGNTSPSFVVECNFKKPSDISFLDFNIEVNEKQYSNKLTRHPAKNSLIVDLKIPYTKKEQSVLMQVILNGESKKYTLNLLNDSKHISYKKALDIAEKTFADDISKLTNGTAFLGEVFCILYFDNNKLFYIVTLITPNNTQSSLLLTSETGEILARHKS